MQASSAPAPIMDRYVSTTERIEEKKLSPDDFLKMRDLYLANPERYIQDVFGDKIWQVQIDIVRSVFEFKLTAVKTCNAIGKSFIAARIVLAYLMLYKDSIVVTTAPTWRQVTDVLWREIGTALKMSRYKLTNKEASQAGLSIDKKWYAVGLSTSRPENFFGYHARHILVVVDEAGGVDESIFKGVAAITPNSTARILYIGNPTEPTGTFYDVFNKEELGANCFTVSAFDTPNFVMTGIRDVNDLVAMFTPPQSLSQAQWTKIINGIIEPRMDPTFRETLISPSVVYGRYFEWGADSPAWQSLVMGEFPTQSNMALIPVNLVREAMNMYGTEEHWFNPETLQMEHDVPYWKINGWDIPESIFWEYGQDVARQGGDENVLIARHGGWVEEPIAWNKKGEIKADLMETAERIMNIINPLSDNVRLNIDDTGLGGGVTDRLRQLNRESQAGGKPAHRYSLVDYGFASKVRMSEKDKLVYADITSKIYWQLRTWFYNKQIAIPWDQQLFDELVSRRVKWDKDGRIKVETKDEYKKRTGGKSPDRSDALALAFASGGTVKPVAEVAVPAPAPEQRQSRYDDDDQYADLDAMIGDEGAIMAGLDERH